MAAIYNSHLTASLPKEKVGLKEKTNPGKQIRAKYERWKDGFLGCLDQATPGLPCV